VAVYCVISRRGKEKFNNSLVITVSGRPGFRSGQLPKCRQGQGVAGMGQQSCALLQLLPERTGPRMATLGGVSVATHLRTNAGRVHSCRQSSHVEVLAATGPEGDDPGDVAIGLPNDNIYHTRDTIQPASLAPGSPLTCSHL
jgi:hypothetical protein